MSLKDINGTIIKTGAFLVFPEMGPGSVRPILKYAVALKAKLLRRKSKTGKVYSSFQLRVMEAGRRYNTLHLKFSTIPVPGAVLVIPKSVASILIPKGIRQSLVEALDVWQKANSWRKKNR